MQVTIEPPTSTDAVLIVACNPPETSTALPPNLNRLLKIHKAFILGEQETFADKVISTDPFVYATSTCQSQPSSLAQTNDEPITKKPAALRLNITQLIALTRQLIQSQAAFFAYHRRKSGGQSLLRDRPNSLATNPSWHRYRQVYGPQVRKPPSTQVAEVGATVPAENRLHVFDRNTKIKFLIDSGSDISLLPNQVLRRSLTSVSPDESPHSAHSR